MHNAPEGLEYGTDNYKYKKADKCTPELEKGKYQLLKHERSGERNEASFVEHDRAGLERMLGMASKDPYYKKNGKNK